MIDISFISIALISIQFLWLTILTMKALQILGDLQDRARMEDKRRERKGRDQSRRTTVTIRDFR